MKQKLTREQQEYDKLVHRVTPRSEVPFALLKAFVVGGIICCIGQLVADFGKNMWGLEQKDASTLGSVFLVFLASLLTGLGVFDQLGNDDRIVGIISHVEDLRERIDRQIIVNKSHAGSTLTVRL